MSFERTWIEYANGFGNAEGNYWLGLHHIHNFTSSEPYQLRVDLMDFDGVKGYATYGTFRVASEADQFKATIGGYSGNVGDSMKFCDGMKFSTKDRDNDILGNVHCSREGHSGWWHKDCKAVQISLSY